jgi:CDP-diacylglycerol--serine O-phosphatidyltransferase
MKKYFIGQYRFCDLITMCGTLSAIIGIILSLYGYEVVPFILLFVCSIFDSIDGLFARKRKNTEFESTYGVELDSLSDMISFGIFPIVLALNTVDYNLIYIIAPIYGLCGLIRLAYFNTLNITKTSEKGYFRGVPITTIAFIYPLIYILHLINYDVYGIASIITLIVLGILFISNIRVKKPDISKLFSRKKI